MGCNHYLCGMDESIIIKRYVGGDTISAIAKDADVSRQAIIKQLKKAGVHNVVVKPSEKVKPKKLDAKPSSISQKTLNNISSFVFAEARGEEGFGDNVFWRDGFYWKRWVGFNLLLENVPLVELNDTFGEKTPAV